MNKKSLLINLLFLLLTFFLIYNFYVKIIIPSKLSVINSCNETLFEERYGEHYYVAGIVELKIKGNLTENSKYVDIEDLNGKDLVIQIILNNNDTKTLKHELCHISQLSNGRQFSSLSCKHLNKKLFSEFECYMTQFYPNWLYENLYYNLDNTNMVIEYKN